MRPPEGEPVTEPSSHRTSAPSPCGRRFDEELLSGYLDHALTQGERQRVRLHLEDCPACRAELQEMTALREAAMTTRFAMPSDDQWNEAPRGAGSLWSRRAGWLLVVVWIAAIAGFALWELATGPAALVEKLFVFAGLTGAALLFVSVLVDRLRTWPLDRYRRVPK